MTVEVFNPLDKRALAESIEKKLLEDLPKKLGETRELVGAGIYAIYYCGDFPIYEPISKINISDLKKPPIYVGKAAPKGSRKGGLGFNVTDGTPLRDRLRNHYRVIDQAKNLDASDFHFRCLVVDDVWIPLGENILIDNFKPVWNVTLDGFGSNKPGVRRQSQNRSSWDTLHPGRAWADLTSENNKSVEDILEKIRVALT